MGQGHAELESKARNQLPGQLHSNIKSRSPQARVMVLGHLPSFDAIA
ncbi:hypothetical protein ACH4MA_03755 [Streptomyces roseolus]